MLKFITGNKNKFAEVSAMLAPLEVEQLDIDLTEIQSFDAHKIIKHKLQEALSKAEGEIIVEDTSLYMECLNYKLPGPFIKWFLESIGPKGIADMARLSGKSKSYGVTIFGYARSADEIRFFEAKNDGEIVSPVGDKDFGWGPIFKPDGFDKTYGEMDREEKYNYSMRALAAKELKAYLTK